MLPLRFVPSLNILQEQRDPIAQRHQHQVFRIIKTDNNRNGCTIEREKDQEKERKKWIEIQRMEEVMMMMMMMMEDIHDTHKWSVGCRRVYQSIHHKRRRRRRAKKYTSVDVVGWSSDRGRIARCRSHFPRFIDEGCCWKEGRTNYDIQEYTIDIYIYIILYKGI